MLAIHVARFRKEDPRTAWGRGRAFFGERHLGASGGPTAIRIRYTDALAHANTRLSANIFEGWIRLKRGNPTSTSPFQGALSRATPLATRQQLRPTPPISSPHLPCLPTYLSTAHIHLRLHRPHPTYQILPTSTTKDTQHVPPRRHTLGSALHTSHAPLHTVQKRRLAVARARCGRRGGQ